MAVKRKRTATKTKKTSRSTVKRIRRSAGTKNAKTLTKKYSAYSKPKPGKTLGRGGTRKGSSNRKMAPKPNYSKKNSTHPTDIVPKAMRAAHTPYTPEQAKLLTKVEQKVAKGRRQRWKEHGKLVSKSVKFIGHMAKEGDKLAEGLAKLQGVATGAVIASGGDPIAVGFQKVTSGAAAYDRAYKKIASLSSEGGYARKFVKMAEDAYMKRQNQPILKALPMSTNYPKEDIAPTTFPEDDL